MRADIDQPRSRVIFRKGAYATLTEAADRSKNIRYRKIGRHRNGIEAMPRVQRKGQYFCRCLSEVRKETPYHWHDRLYCGLCRHRGCDCGFCNQRQCRPAVAIGLAQNWLKPQNTVRMAAVCCFLGRRGRHRMQHLARGARPQPPAISFSTDISPLPRTPVRIGGVAAIPRGPLRRVPLRAM